MELILQPVVNLGPMAQPITRANMEQFASAAASGQFPIAGNHYWHGGLHFKVPSNHAVQAVARGRIIAYRINDDWKEYEPEPGSGNKEKYSTSFVLIEHDLERDYLNGEVLFEKCKFYSLYMNLLPLSQLSGKDRLPWFMCCSRSEHTSPVGRRGEVVHMLQQTNGMAKTRLAGSECWLPLRFFAQRLPIGSSSDRYLADPVYFTYDDPSSILGALQMDAVVASDILVEAGDIIGYPGGMQVSAGTFNDDTFHFETFFDDANVDFFGNTGSFVYAKNKSISGLGVGAGKMGAGKYWWNMAPVGSPSSPPNWVEHYNINADQVSAGLTPVYEHFAYEPPMSTTAAAASPTLPVVSDLDWKDGGEPWVFRSGTDFFDTNGHVDHAKTLPAARETRRLAVRQRSEWSDADLPGRFSALQSGEPAQGLPKLESDAFSAFVNHVRDHCFWSEVPSLPAATNVWYLNPIYCIEKLQRCMVPYHNSAPLSQAKFYRRCLNESLQLLKRRKQELTASPIAPASQVRFTRWFGYSPGMTISPNAAWTAFSHGAQTTIAHVATFHDAVTHIVRMIDLSIRSLEEEIELWCLLPNYWFGNVTRNGAYVFHDDVTMKNIHLGGYFIGATDTATAVPSITDATTITWGREVRIFLHEFSHFNDLGGLMDVKINDGAVPISTEYGPYGGGDCQQIALNFPSASLMNADNFSFFLADGIDGTAEATEYFSYLD